MDKYSIMKKSIFPFALLILLAVFVSRCGFSAIAGEAEKYADQFYGHLKKHDYNSIVDMLDEEATAASPVEDWIRVLSQKEQFGNLEKVDKNMGFNTSINNGKTFVSFRYTCEYTDIKFHEKLIFIKRGEIFKVYNYEYNENRNAISKD